MSKRLMITLGLGLSLFACDHDHDHDHDHKHEGVDHHACEHVTDGPFATISAAADFTAAEEGFERHTKVTVNLVAMPSGQNGGFVKFTPPEDGEYRFLLDSDVGMMLHSADNMHMDWEFMGSPDGCDAATSAFQSGPLTAGTAYLLVFGPTTADSVAFVAEEAEHEAEGGGHGHDH